MNDINSLGVTHGSDTGSSAGVANSLFPRMHPKWVCAELRSLTTATNLVSWQKASFGGFTVYEWGFRWARRREGSTFPEPNCVQSARKD